MTYTPAPNALTLNSRESYAEVLRSGLCARMQLTILDCLAKSGVKLTASEIAHYLKVQVSVVRPRLRELVLMDILKTGLSRMCTRTGKTASAYEFTGRPGRKLMQEFKRCEACNGKGKIAL